jgi:uncharacterized protein (TIRG00374 family)
VRLLKFTYLFGGLALLAVILKDIDFGEVADYLSHLGWGAAVVLLISLLVFLIDTFTWQMALPRVPLTATWLYRMFKVRLVGEAFNAVIPAAGMGGEPVKAILLNKRYGIPYAEGIASVVLGRTVNMFALIPFLLVGFALVVANPSLDGSIEMTAAIGLIGFVAATGILFGVQWFRLTSSTGAWISRFRYGQWILGLLHHLQDMDAGFVRFYSEHRTRLLGSTCLSVLQWLLGALEVYYTLDFLGHPISFADAWIIEAIAQLVRAATFFIPANIGVMEGGFVVVCAALTGSPALGVATVAVRRFRELVWIAWGFGTGWRELAPLQARAAP